MSHVFGRILSEIFDDSALFARRVSYSHSCSRIRISENLKKFGEEKFVIIICCNYLHVPSKIRKRKVSLLDILEKPNLELISPVVYMRFHELVDKNLIMISIFSPSSFFFFPERITKQLEIKGTTCAKRSMISITCQTSCKIV